MTGTSVLTPPGDDPSSFYRAENKGLTMIQERDDEHLKEDDGHANDHANDAHSDDYENMSYSEMSKRMAETHRQLAHLLTPTEEKEDADDTTEDESMNDNMNMNMSEAELVRSDLDDTQKQQKMTRLFSRAASTGDLERVTRLLEDKTFRPWIDIDAKDEDGTTPLIYAACFGKVDIAQALLQAGAKPDIQDGSGWSALMWATNNNQEAVVKVLLEHGASSQQKSAKGRTVFDFVNTDNQKIVEILATNPRDSVSSTSSLFGRYAGSLSSTTSSNAGDCDFYYQSTVEGYDSFMAEEADRRKKLLESAMALAGGDTESEGEDNEDDDFESDEEQEFHWDKCMPDQMFVFSADNLDHILDTVITNMQLPVKSRQEICVPANVVFLSSRFAHYFSSDELLEQVLRGTLQRVGEEMKSNARNVHVLAFWITNMTQLLYYLKKDTSLVVATAEYQLRISELISEIYTMIVNDTERRIHKVLGAAILEHEQIPGMEDVNFADDWQRFFRRSSRRSVIVPPDGGLAVQLKQHRHTACHVLSPQSITSLLTSTLYVLQAYEVHPTIIIQALAQFIHYMSCELFNRILTNKKLLCRSKALQIRMNLSLMEEWVRENELPPSLISYFDPTTQLLQMLQCLTQLTDLASFLQTVKKFDALNALQLKRCVINYRYEVNEPRLPEEVEKYVLQLAEDTLRFRQAREPRKRTGSISMARAQTSTGLQRTRSRRESVSNFVGSIMSSVGLATSASLPPTMPSTEKEEQDEEDKKEEEEHTPRHSHDSDTHGLTEEDTKAQEDSTASSDQDDKREDVEPTAVAKEVETLSMTEEHEKDEEDVEEKEMKETRDSKFMLPFSVPTTVHMVSVNGWNDQNSKAGEQRCVIPIIPDSWMDKLDKDSLE